MTAERGPGRADLAVVAALTVTAIGLRAPGLGPSSLWLDDAWVAFAHRAPWSEITEIGLSAPGFSAVLKLWFAVVGFGEVQAQLLPFAAGVAAPALTYLIVRVRASPVPALFGGLWMLLLPIHVEYSTRVKQYTIEVVFCLVLVHLAWRLLEEPDDTRRWRTLALVAGAAVLFSFPLASVAGAACAVPALASLARRRRLDAALVWLALPLTVTVGWYGLVIRHRQYPDLRSFWSTAFIQTDAGARIAAESALGRVHDVFEFAAPLPATGSAVVVGGLGLVLLWRRPLHALVVALPVGAAVVLAALERAPLGGGRTDLYLIGGVVLAAAMGLDEVLASVRARMPGPATTAVAAAVLVGLFGVALVGYERPRYPDQDIRPLVDELARRRAPGDAVLVYHNGKWAYATYSDTPVTVRPVSAPYDVVFDDPAVVRQYYPWNDERLRASVDDVDGRGERVWLIGSQLQASWDRTVAALTATGRTVTESWERPGAALLLFEPPPSF